MLNVKNGVLTGTDGWLFLYQGGQSQFDFLIGKKLPDDESTTSFYQNIKSRTAYFHKNDIKYKHIVFPSKPLLKDKYLPIKLKQTIQSVFERSYLNKIDQVTQQSIYYPLQDLSELEKKYSTFKKLDTHMTDRSYLHIATHLLQDINPKILNHPTFINNQKIKGDLSHMISSNEKNNEEVIYLDNKNIYEVGNREFLPSNTNEVVITHSHNPQVKQRLLIFGDSFFKDVIKYLYPFFKDIMYIRSSTMQYDIVELYKPDVVFSGNAERYLSHVLSDDEAPTFMHELYGNKEYHPSQEYLSAFKANLSFNHFPHIYKQWVDRNKKSIEPSLKLTEFTLNKHIQRKDTPHYLKFDSIGNDPYIIYNHVDFKEGGNYKLSISLISNVKSTFQIFFTDARVRPLVFEEPLSTRHPIKEGLNQLSITLSFPFLGETMRIDPINTLGTIEILKIKLHEI